MENVGEKFCSLPFFYNNVEKLLHVVLEYLMC